MSYSAIVPISDPSVYRPSLLTILFGGPGSGKSRLAMTYPDPLIVDMDGTIGRLREFGDARVVHVNDDRDVCSLAADIARGDIKVGTLVIDGFTRLLQQLESEIGTLHKDQYWRTYRDRVNALMLAFTSLPCHVVLTARSRAIRAKAGDVVGGYLVAASENVPIGETPDLFSGISDVADMIIRLENTETGWSANTWLSLINAFPQHETFDNPLEQIPKRMAALTTQLAAIPSIVPAAAPEPKTIPSVPEIKQLFAERNLLATEKLPKVSEFMQQQCGWNGKTPIPDAMRIKAVELLSAEIATIKAAINASPPVLTIVPDLKPSPDDATPLSTPAITAPESTATATASESPEALMAYAQETIGLHEAIVPITDAELVSSLRHRNSICRPQIMSVPKYIRDICGLQHVQSSHDIRPEDRVTAMTYMRNEVAQQEKRP